ncbi:MAG TPA: pirin family protein [Polyangiaceae bacterium]|nr:pirin family protein [Polyangiaceae bacterium]
MSDDPILDTGPLGFPWVTVDPFLFCVHHDDAYPKGDENMGPAVSLAGRNLGQDFTVKDGFRMYHGHVVPGFPQHPHRGFETVTIARRGYIDHSDSLGAAARFGHGDVQWLTAGGGIVHSEMFPLVKRDEPNPVELFQIWLNLPAADKLSPPHFSMLWAKDIPEVVLKDAAGRRTAVTVVAGAFQGKTPPPPPPRSWASRADSDVAIWCVKMEPAAVFTLPRAAGDRTLRVLYFFAGKSLRVAGKTFEEPRAIALDGRAEVRLENGPTETELLVLQGRPIGEPVVQHGPFVMNTREEIQRAIQDYQRTGFGGWPWPVDDPVHGRETGRFARHADGKTENAAE